MGKAATHGSDAPRPVHPAYRSLAALYAAQARDEAEPRPGFSPTLVPGEGPVGAPLMLVGEQPGDQEDKAGRPFVGPAGRLLDTCLADAGLARRDLFVTNAVKRFKYSLRGKRRMHRTPTAGDIKHYRWWLEAEIGLVGPRLIVALGGTALRALTGRSGLGAIRGTLLDHDGRPLIATIHPSYLFRFRGAEERHAERARFVAELVTAREAAGMAA